MTTTSVRTPPTLPDERIRNTLRREIDRAINLDRSTTRAQLAVDSGVNIHSIDAILTHDKAKHRRIASEDALSLVWALGDRAVQAYVALIGYSARRHDEPDDQQPMMIAASAMAHLSTIATAAADGRIDHTEAPLCREAADCLIATVLPLSSAGVRA